MNPPSRRLILATNNPHKVTEIRTMLRDTPIEILCAGDFNDFPIVREEGKDLVENAIIKSRTVWQKYRQPCLADDTGLEVETLGGAPGVHSARYAGKGCSFDDNNKKLLQVLKGVRLEERRARFRTVIAFADADGRIEWRDGILEGFIAFEPKGSYGFGYDPIFLVERSGMTLAEYPPEQKNRISHRAKALAKIRSLILEALAR